MNRYRLKFIALLIAVVEVYGCTLKQNQNDGEVELPFDAVKKWEDNMVKYGKKWGSSISCTDDTYYDAEWIFYQIKDYTGNNYPWQSYADMAEKFYRDTFCRPDFNIHGYWCFPHGLFEDCKRGGDTKPEQILKMRDNPGFSDPDTNNSFEKWYHVKFSREIAYGIHRQLTAEKAGFPRQENRVRRYLEMVENHLRQWKEQDFTNPVGEHFRSNVKPFMVGLTLHALIDFYEWEVSNGRSPDAYIEDIPGRIADIASWMYSKARVRTGPFAGKTLWISNYEDGYGAFRYSDDDSMGVKAAPDLNLLIAPAYAWGYKMTGNKLLRTAADRIFVSGVNLASIEWNPKIFNQNYRWSFKYIEWREQGDRKWNNRH